MIKLNLSIFNFSLVLLFTLSGNLLCQLPQTAASEFSPLPGISLCLNGEVFLTKSLLFAELKGGMTSACLYTFEAQGKKYVLRLLNPKHSLESRKNEIAAHTLAAKRGLAPELSYVDENFTFLVMPFIEGRTLTQADLKQKSILESLGNMLRKLHDNKGDFLESKTQTIRARKHYEKAVKKGIAFPSVYKSLYDNYIAEEKRINKGSGSLCHADLNPGNILISEKGRLYFIDWTSATEDNPYTDLGYFTFVNGLSDEQSKIFLKAYFERDINQEEWKQFKIAQKRTSFLTATVWFDFSESEQEKSVSLPERVKKLDFLLNSPHLKEGQDYIAAEETVSPLSKDYEAIKLYALGFLKTYINFKIP